MFSTAKEVHVYVDAAIQQASSNRKQSIDPHIVDMFLNNAVLEDISSKFPNRYNQKDIEGTLKRYTDYDRLFTSMPGGVEINDSGQYPHVSLVKPHNAIRIKNVVCSYIRPFKEVNTTVGRKYSLEISINDNIYSETSLTLTLVYSKNGVSKTNTISFDSFIKDVKSKNGVFYLYTSMIDTLRNVYGLNVRYDSSDSKGNRLITIEPPIGTVIIQAKINSSNAVCSIKETLIRTTVSTVGRPAPCSIMSEYDANVGLADYYRSRNLHIDPITTIDENFINIYYTDFIPTNAIVSYIRKPKLFNIATGQIPEIEINKDFLDMAVKQFLLVLNSPNYERVLNESIKNL